VVATIAGFKGTVTEVQEATRFSMATAKARVAEAGAFKPTSAGVRNVSLDPGAAFVCGVYYEETATQSVALSSNSGASPRLDVIVLRFTWAGDNSIVAVAVKSGVVGSTTPPALTRVPGGVYEFPLAVVRDRPSVSVIAAADVMDVRVHGGFGGPFMIPQTEYASIVDLPLGAELQSDTTVYTVTANDGAGNTSLSLTTASALPWTAYDPVLWTGNRVVCNLGAGGIRRGQYQLDPATSTCHVKFEIRKGTGNINFGAEPFGIDLPAGIRPTSVFADQWGEGLLNTNVGDGFYNWLVKYLIRRDQFNQTGYVVPYAVTNGADNRLLPMRSSAADGNPAGAIPQVRSSPGGPIVYLDPNVITGSFSYIVE